MPELEKPVFNEFYSNNYNFPLVNYENKYCFITIIFIIVINFYIVSISFISCRTAIPN